MRFECHASVCCDCICVVFIWLIWTRNRLNSNRDTRSIITVWQMYFVNWWISHYQLGNQLSQRALIENYALQMYLWWDNEHFILLRSGSLPWRSCVATRSKALVSKSEIAGLISAKSAHFFPRVSSAMDTTIKTDPTDDRRGGVNKWSYLANDSFNVVPAEV